MTATTSTPAPLFSGENLGCIRGDRPVFAGLDFALAPGEALVLSGPNGSGKSSLLRMLAGLLAPVAGVLRWNGADVAENPEAHAARLHYLGHHNAVKPTLTVAENLHTWAALRGRGRAAVPAALATFGLEDLAGVPGRLLSSGQTRRLALARLVAAPAPLWLLDEPSVGLDRAALAGLAEVIAAHRAGGGCLVLATHQDLGLPDAKRLAVDDFPPAQLVAAQLVETALW
jgi:heme exporter protein A